MNVYVVKKRVSQKCIKIREITFLSINKTYWKELNLSCQSVNLREINCIKAYSNLLLLILKLILFDLSSSGEYQINYKEA